MQTVVMHIIIITEVAIKKCDKTLYPSSISPFKWWKKFQNLLQLRETLIAAFSPVFEFWKNDLVRSGINKSKIDKKTK